MDFTINEDYLKFNYHNWKSSLKMMQKLPKLYDKLDIYDRDRIVLEYLGTWFIYTGYTDCIEVLKHEYVYKKLLERYMEKETREGRVLF